MRSFLPRDGEDKHIHHDEDESKCSALGYDFDFDSSVMDNSNNGKPPPQPATAAVNAIHWEVEEDHLLSYFLGASEGAAATATATANNSIPESDVAVDSPNSNNVNTNISTGTQRVAGAADLASTVQRLESQPSMGSASANMASMAAAAAAHNAHMGSSLESFVHARAMTGGESSGGLSTSSSAGLGGGSAATSAVHFYDGSGNHSHHPSSFGQNDQQGSIVVGGGPLVHPLPPHLQQHQHRHPSSGSLPNRTGSHGSMSMPGVPSRTMSAASSASSSSSLTSMAAALALGGPNQVMYMQQKLQSRDQLGGVHIGGNGGMSPITPVNMMGSPSGHEMMMLPPPPRFPNGSAMPGHQHHQLGGGIQAHQGMQQMVHQNQQHVIMMQGQQAMQQQQQQQNQQMMRSQHHQVMPQIAEPAEANQLSSANNGGMAPQSVRANRQQQQQTTHNFLPQMNPPASVAPPVRVHPQPPLDQKPHAGFPDPNSVANAVLAQPQSAQPLQQQPVAIPQQHPQQQQIQIGLNGHSIPLTAVPGVNGSVYYQIDPTAVGAPSGVPASGLRYFTKAINDVSKPDDQREQIDPEVLAEKRRQRLARNRESARQSRRRKKEHLSNLAAKVQRLQRQLEGEVRNKIGSMEGGLGRQRDRMIDGWLAGEAKVAGEGYYGNCADLKPPVTAVRGMGPSCPVRLAVAAHQFGLLRQAFLSTHGHYAVWLMMQSSRFFTEASRMRQMMGQAVNGQSSAASTLSSSSSRANSKQIGEEIYGEERGRGGGGGGKATLTCRAGDMTRNWPLYCHEVTMTMEQEDRIINQAHGQARSTPNLQTKLKNIKTATDATRHLENAMLCHAQLASQRNGLILLDVLTPSQTALFLKWVKNNRERCRAIMDRRYRSSGGIAASSALSAEGKSTLVGVCRQLEEMRLQNDSGH